MTHTLIDNDPQNPYKSFLVKASAGTGKTFQLSKRFLALVAAGTDPSLILTVTFTKKAAGEMRQRILREAQLLLADGDVATKFNAQMQKYYREQIDLPPPLSAQQTASIILATQQNLSVKTIDSLFSGWVKSFDHEAADDLPLPAQMELLADYEAQDFRDKAWVATLEKLRDNHPLMQDLARIFPLEGFSAIWKRLQVLAKHELLIWLGSQKNEQKLHIYPLPEPPVGQTVASALNFFRTIKVDLGPAGKTEVSALLDACSDQSDNEQFIKTLRDLSIIGKNTQLHGNKYKKIKNTYPVESTEVQGFINFIHNQKVIRELNGIVSLFSLLLETFQKSFNSLKYSQNRVDYNDMAKGAYRLFSLPDSIGARYLIQRGIHHILLDEFQDTNALQWSIFAAIANELLSGANHDLADRSGPGTLFIVGDEKQSIYGFRQADAELLGQVEQEYSTRLNTVALNESFRSSQVLFDVINACFSSPQNSCFLKNFPRHQTAQINGEKVIPDVGSFTLAPLFADDEKSESIGRRQKGFEKEAEFVALYCQKLLQQKEATIWDKNSNSLRSIRPSDIVILYRSTTHSAIYEKSLIKHGIAYRKAENKGFFQQAEVQDIFALFRMLCLPGDIQSLCAVLRSPIVGIDETKLVELLSQSLDADVEERIALICQGNYQAQEIYNFAIARQPSDLSAYQRFLALLIRLNVADKYKSAWPHLAERCRSHLDQFCDILAGFSGLSDVQMLFRLEQMRDEDTLGLSGENDQSVHMMTIHKSKGLEYPVVFLVGAANSWTIGENYWSKNEQKLYYMGIKKDEHPVQYPPFDEVLAVEASAQHQENIRLLYVALTRAGHHAIVSAYGRKAAHFYADLSATMQELQTDSVDFHNLTLKTLKRNQTHTVNQTPKEKPVTISFPKKSIVEPLIPSEIRNVTPHKIQDAKSMKTTNLKFEPQYYQAIGLWVHKGLEQHVRKNEWNPEAEWTSVIRQIGWQSSPLQSQAYLDAEKQLSDCLASQAWTQLFQNCKTAKAEMPITYLGGRGLVHGVIDLVTESEDGAVTVTDYKSVVLPDQEWSDESLRQFCDEKGYLSQVEAYVRGCELLYPSKKVFGGVFFTALNIYISLNLW